MRIAVLPLLLTLTLSFNASAYDEDTHFYGTYTMARYAGIKHEIAVKLALSAQWMDESYISDPMSTIVLFLSGVKKRRLLHFPSDRMAGSLNAEAQRSMIDLSQIQLVRWMADYFDYEGDLTKLNLMSETEADHPFASELLMEGLKEGNLMKAGASLHVLEDSYAHAGTPAEEGHRGFWHWPDRPFSNPTKYFQMTYSVFQAMAAIRMMLPESALDCQLRTTESGQPNCGTSPEILNANFMMNPDVYNTIARDVLKDPVYVRTAVREIFLRARGQNVKYINMTEAQANEFCDRLRIDGSKNAYETLEGIIADMAGNYIRNGDPTLNVYAVIADLTSLNTRSGEEVLHYIRVHGIEDGLLTDPNNPAFKTFTRLMAKKILRWHVPRELNDYHRIEIEDDSSSIRKAEMDVRVANMQALIRKLFNVNLEMIPNHTKDDKGFANEVWMTPAAEAKPPVNPRPGVEYVTFNLYEKNRWAIMIFNFLYPGLKEDDLKTIVNFSARYKKIQRERAEYWQKRKEIKESDSYYVTKKAQLAKLDVTYFQILTDSFSLAKAIREIQPLGKQWFKDLFESRIEPKPDNYFYHSTKFLEAYQRDRVIRKFLGPDDVWNQDVILVKKPVPTSRKNIPMVTF